MRFSFPSSLSVILKSRIMFAPDESAFEHGQRGHHDWDSLVRHRFTVLVVSSSGVQMAQVSSISRNRISGFAMFDDVHADDLTLSIHAKEVEVFEESEHETTENSSPQSNDEQASDVHA